MDHDGCKTLASAWKEATGKEAIFSGLKAVCDVTLFGKKDMPSVIFGPAGERLHGTDERMPIRSLLECIKA
jgi:acetylornithine deacetylase/succinyl-diaminopimelate desuccinylase-like protein